MSVITLPKVLREKLGDDGAEALVEVINKSESSKELATKADLANFATKTDLSEEIGKVRVEIANAKTDMIKWMFLFWIGQLAAMTAIIKFFLVK